MVYNKFMIPLRRRYFIYTAVGIISFIFFGFFFPILILPQPLEEEPVIGQVSPTPLPVAVDTGGKDVVLGALAFTDRMRLTSRIDRVSCFKKHPGEAGDCKTADTSDLLPGYLIPTYAAAARFTGGEQWQKNYREVLTTTLDLCGRNVAACRLSLLPLYHEYQQSHDERILTAISQTGTELLSNPQSSFVSFSQDVERLMVLYKLTHDRAYLTEALTRAGDASTVAANDGQNTIIAFDQRLGGNIRRFDCGLFGQIYLSIYPELNDEAYLTKSREFFSLLPRFVNRLGTAEAVGLCLDGLTLSTAAGDSAANELRQKVLTYVLNAYWDSAQVPKFTRDGGFLTADYTVSPTNQIFNFKYPLEHAWILSHVVEFPDTVFHLTGTNL